MQRCVGSRCSPITDSRCSVDSRTGMSRRATNGISSMAVRTKSTRSCTASWTSASCSDACSGAGSRIAWSTIVWIAAGVKMRERACRSAVLRSWAKNARSASQPADWDAIRPRADACWAKAWCPICCSTWCSRVCPACSSRAPLAGNPLTTRRSIAQRRPGRMLGWQPEQGWVEGVGGGGGSTGRGLATAVPASVSNAAARRPGSWRRCSNFMARNMGMCSMLRRLWRRSSRDDTTSSTNPRQALASVRVEGSVRVCWNTDVAAASGRQSGCRAVAPRMTSAP